MATRPRRRRHRRHRRIRTCRAGSARSRRDCCLLSQGFDRWATTACSIAARVFDAPRSVVARWSALLARSAPAAIGLLVWPAWSGPAGLARWSWPCWSWPCWSWPCWSLRPARSLALLVLVLLVLPLRGLGRSPGARVALLVFALLALPARRPRRLRPSCRRRHRTSLRPFTETVSGFVTAAEARRAMNGVACHLIRLGGTGIVRGRRGFGKGQSAAETAHEKAGDHEAGRRCDLHTRTHSSPPLTAMPAGAVH